MDALEVPSEGVTGKEWERIATCVGGNRTLMEVRERKLSVLIFSSPSISSLCSVMTPKRQQHKASLFEVEL